MIIKFLIKRSVIKFFHPADVKSFYSEIVLIKYMVKFETKQIIKLILLDLM